MSQVLLLNATYEPLTFLPVRRAVVLLMKERAQVVKADVERRIRSERDEMALPLVIRLVSYVRIPFAQAAWSRKAVLMRDGVCQYCGRQGTREHPLTVDHVVPRSAGGANSWLNTVAACYSCNHRKAGRTPQQAGMRLRREPFVPTYAAVVWLGYASVHDDQREFLLPYRDRD